LKNPEPNFPRLTIYQNKSDLIFEYQKNKRTGFFVETVIDPKTIKIGDKTKKYIKNFYTNTNKGTDLKLFKEYIKYFAKEFQIINIHTTEIGDYTIDLRQIQKWIKDTYPEYYI
jgi:hypothetical protein